ncbi:MAG: hypothetical protein ABEH35_05040 [Haloarculaceae archaeon]
MNSQSQRFVWGDSESSSTAKEISVSDDSSNILLLSEATGGDEGPACGMLSSLTAGADWNALLVTYGESGERRLEEWREHVDGAPQSVTVLSIQGGDGPTTISTTTENGSGVISFKRISDPDDLVRLGLAISNCLGDWEDAGQRGIVCFDSITALLQFVDLERSFRFFHTLKYQVQSKGAVAHYHMDPTALDDQTVIKLRSLFDEVVRTGTVDEAE